MGISSVISLLFLASFALAQPWFIPGKEYEFSYEGRVASSLLGVPPQYAGLGIKAKVACIVKDPQTIVIQIREPRVAKLNDKLRSEQAFFKEELPISYSPVAQYAQQLQAPFQVTLRSGIVAKVEIQEREPEVMKNLKRGIAALVQVNSNGVEKVRAGSDMLLPESEENSQRMSFSVMEESIFGICETMYSISPLPEYLAQAEEKQIPAEFRKVTSEGHLVISKTVNFDNCVRQSAYLKVAPMTKECRLDGASCRATQARASTVRFLVEGKRSNYMIKSVWNKGEFVLKSADADVRSMSYQAMHLQKVAPARAPSVQSSRNAGLAFQVPKPEGQAQEPSEQTLMDKPVDSVEQAAQQQQQSPQEIKAKVKQLLEEVSRQVEDFSRPRSSVAPAKVAIISRGIKSLQYSDLKSLSQEILRNKSPSRDESTKQQIFVDCLALSGSNPSIRVIKDMAAEGLIKGERLAQVLMTLPMTVTIPIPAVISEMVDIARLPQVQSDSQANSSALLAVSNIAYQACVNQNISRRSYPIPMFEKQACSPNHEVVVGKVLPLLKEALEKAHWHQDKEVAIRALGNVAHPQVLPILKRYVWGSKQLKDVQIRTMAIYSLDRLAKLSSKEVREILIPVMNNPEDHFEPRIAAITMVLETNPPSAIVQQIAVSTWFEPSQQVQSFVWCTLQSLSNSSFPSYNETDMAEKAEMALSLAKPVEEGLQYSHNSIFSKYIRQQRLASKLEVNSIGSVDSLIPRRLYAKLRSNIRGYEFSPVQFSIFNQGTQSLINKILFPEEISQSGKSQSLWSQSETEILRSIKADIKESDETRGRLHIKLYDAMERIFSYDNTSQAIKSLLEQRTLNLQSWNLEQEINVQKVLPMRQSEWTLPSELGLPVQISIQMPAVASLRGKIYASVQPSQIRASSIQKGQTSARVQLSADVKPYLAVQRLATASVVSPFFPEIPMAGAEQYLQSGLPGNYTFKLYTQNRSAEIQFTPKQESSEVSLVYVHSKPFTALYKPKDMRPVAESPEYKAIKAVEQPMQKSVEFGRKHFGLDLQAELKTEEKSSSFPSYYQWLKQHTPLSAINFIYAQPGPICNRQAAIVFKPTSSETKTIRAVFQYGVRPAEEARQEKSKPVRVPAERYRSERGSGKYWQASPSELEQVSYRDAYNYSVNASIEFQGSSRRWYNASLSVVNATTPSVHSARLSAMLRQSQIPGAQPREIIVESEIQVPVLKARKIQEFLGNPVFASAKTEVFLPQQQKLRFDLKMERDQQQQEFARASAEWKRCEQDEQRGMFYSYNCSMARIQATSLNKIRFEAAKDSGRPLSETASKALYAIDNFFKYALYPHMSNDISLQSSIPSAVQIEARRDPFTQTWDVEAKKPHETTTFQSVQEPASLKSILPAGTKLSPARSLAEKVMRGDYYPFCKAQASYLRTFDNVTISLKEASPSCWHLLAKDCSDEANFGILVRPSQSGKELRIILGETRIELRPAQRQPKVYVDGKEVKIERSQPRYEQRHGYTVAKISQLPNQEIEVDSPLYRLTVTHDGRDAGLQMSNAYRNRACGLCGDMNGEPEADLKTPQQCALNATKVKEYFDSWVAEEGSCKPRKIPQEQCNPSQYVPTGAAAARIIPGNYQSTAEESRYEEVNKKVEEPAGVICYSVDKIKQCKAGYEPKAARQEKVAFFCNPPNSSRSQIKYKSVEIPTECRRQ